MLIPRSRHLFRTPGVRLRSLLLFPVILFFSSYHASHAADTGRFIIPVAPVTATENSNAGQPPLLNPGLKKGVLLVAARKLLDPNFEKAVVLVTEFSEQGTAGLVLNRRTSIPAAQAVPQIEQLVPLLDHLYIGGPVLPSAINLLVISGGPVADANNIIDDVYQIDTLELFQALIDSGNDIKSIRLYSGFAGWAPGQLESELLRGDWYLWHGSADIVFSPTPAVLWEELIQIVTARWVAR